MNDSWVNDEVLNDSFRLIIAAQQQPRYSMFNSFLLTNNDSESRLDPKFYEPGDHHRRDRRHDSVIRWTKTIRVCNQNLIIPWNHSNMHWVCAVAEVDERRLTILDSLEGFMLQNDAALELLEKFLKCRLKVEGDLEWDKGWQKQVSHPTLQRDCNSCGLWAIAFAAHVVLDAPLPAAVPDMSLFRFQVAVEMHQRKLFFLKSNGAEIESGKLCDRLLSNKPITSSESATLPAKRKRTNPDEVVHKRSSILAHLKPRRPLNESDFQSMEDKFLVNEAKKASFQPIDIESSKIGERFVNVLRSVRMNQRRNRPSLYQLWSCQSGPTFDCAVTKKIIP
jgi:hypothetical protein